MSTSLATHLLHGLRLCAGVTACLEHCTLQRPALEEVAGGREQSLGSTLLYGMLRFLLGVAGVRTTRY